MNDTATIKPPASVEPSAFPRRRRPTPRKRRDGILIFQHAFPPRPSPDGHQIADIAAELARRGYRIRIYAAAHADDDRYQPPTGVEVVRLRLADFGRASIFRRAAGTVAYAVQSFLRGLFRPNVAGVIVGCSPPLAGIIATALRMFRGMPVAFWAREVDPDRLIVEGRIAPGSLSTRVLRALHRTILQNASLVVAPDRFMAERLYDRARLDDKLVVIPPWLNRLPREPAWPTQRPLFTILALGPWSAEARATLEAAAGRIGEESVCVRFAADSIAETDVDFDASAIATDPRQVGIVHPESLYAALSLGRPVVHIGARPGPVTDFMDRADFGCHVDADNIDACIAAIRWLRDLNPDHRREIGRRGLALVTERLNRQVLCGRFCDGLELVFEKRM